MKFTLPMPDGALPLWLTCHAHIRSDDGSPWVVEGIELYADEACTQLLADDVPYYALPAESQQQLSLWIERAFQARRGTGSLMTVLDEMLGTLSRVRG